MGTKARIFTTLASLALLFTVFCAFRVEADGLQIWWAMGLGVSAWLTVRWGITAAALYTLERLDKAVTRSRKERI